MTRKTHFDADGDNSAQEAYDPEGTLQGAVLEGLVVINPNDADAYFHLYDADSSAVTVGTTTPKQTYKVPSTDYFGANDLDIDFANVITYACTTEATGGNSDPSTGLIVNIWYRDR